MREILLFLAVVATSASVPMHIVNRWGSGDNKWLEGECVINVTQRKAKGDWKMNISLSEDTQELKIWAFKLPPRLQHETGRWYSLKSKYEYVGQVEVRFQLRYSGNIPSGECINDWDVKPTNEQSTSDTSSVPMKVINVWGKGSNKWLEAECAVDVYQRKYIGQWTMNINLDKNTKELKIWSFKLPPKEQHKKGKWYSLVNKYEYFGLVAVRFQLRFRGRTPKGECVSNLPELSTTSTPMISTGSVGTTLTNSVPTVSPSTLPPPTSGIVTTGSTQTTSNLPELRDVPFELTHYWPENGEMKMEGVCQFRISERISNFYIRVDFDSPTSDFMSWIGYIIDKDSDGMWYYLENYWPDDPPTVDVKFHVYFNTAEIQSGTCTLKEMGATEQPSTGQPWTTYPTDKPSTIFPTGQPSSMFPTGQPSTMFPTGLPSTMFPTGQPSTMFPTGQPSTVYPTDQPSTMIPTGQPSTMFPTGQPSTMFPTDQPSTVFPTGQPSTMFPTGQPSTMIPTGQPSTVFPTGQPSTMFPTGQPSTMIPTGQPSTVLPTGKPSTNIPTDQPVTLFPTNQPSTNLPTDQPVTLFPTDQPSTQLPTDQPSTQLPTTDFPAVNTRFDYAKAIELSIMFYEAQRSGDLPANNRIAYRGDSALADGSDNNVNLKGGWYDAGDGVKFNFPMAASTTLLATGLMFWRDAYSAAGQLEYVYDSIKWPLDYFLKCWKPDPMTPRYYAQVGNGDIDHAYWGRHEEMTMWRPSYYVDKDRPGSDVAGETAAAMAAGSIVFYDRDRAYSDKLLNAAEGLYDFAKTYKGKYSDSISDADKFYKSHNGYQDELCLSSVMLYLATDKQQYLNDAKQFVTTGTAWSLSWDEKTVLCQALLAMITNDEKYKTPVKNFVREYMPGGGVEQTNCGLAYRIQWGSLRYSANVAFVALLAADIGIGDAAACKTWAMSQIHYALGDNNYGSYLIGFGNKYPRRPHHRASSCPQKPASCDWTNYDAPGPNPQTLYGALVGGPTEDDAFTDNRKDFVTNEVTTDYNAGFQSSLAGLLHFALDDSLPPAPTPKCTPAQSRGILQVLDKA